MRASRCCCGGRGSGRRSCSPRTSTGSSSAPGSTRSASPRCTARSTACSASPTAGSRCGRPTAWTWPSTRRRCAPRPRCRRCPRCGALARPNILMFGDADWDFSDAGPRLAACTEFIRARRRDLAVVEIGAGGRCPPCGGRPSSRRRRPERSSGSTSASRSARSPRRRHRRARRRGAARPRRPHVGAMSPSRHPALMTGAGRVLLGRLHDLDLVTDLQELEPRLRVGLR